ncbi:putative elicitor peptide [Dioscorea sansibarensis]
MEEGVKLKKMNRDDDDNDDAHPCSSLLHCGIIKAFLGCLGFLDSHDDPLLPINSPDATQDEDYGVITTTENVTMIQGLARRMPRRPAPNPGRGGQIN